MEQIERVVRTCLEARISRSQSKRPNHWAALCLLQKSNRFFFPRSPETPKEINHFIHLSRWTLTISIIASFVVVSLKKTLRLITWVKASIPVEGIRWWLYEQGITVLSTMQTSHAGLSVAFIYALSILHLSRSVQSDFRVSVDQPNDLNTAWTNNRTTYLVISSELLNKMWWNSLVNSRTEGLSSSTKFTTCNLQKQLISPTKRQTHVASIVTCMPSKKK